MAFLRAFSVDAPDFLHPGHGRTHRVEPGYAVSERHQYVSHRLDLIERVAVDDQQVCQRARLDGTEFGDLDKANAALLAAQRMDPMQLFAYGELMFVASLQEDAAEVRHWIEEALRVYPRRWNPIWSFAEQAWGAMERCEEKLEALRKIRLGSPFVGDKLRNEVRTRIRESECSPVRYTAEDRGSAP